jgi:outer membrane lipoprotein-sorting protein
VGVQEKGHSELTKYGLQIIMSFRRIFIVMFLLSAAVAGRCQSAAEIMQKIRTRLDKVNDYEAKGQMKTNVAFIKTPVSNIKVYFKKPNLLRITNETGISFVPKGSVNISLNNIFSNVDRFDIIDGGKNNEGFRVIKLLPKVDTSDIVLASFYVDASSMLVKRSTIATKENGTYELSMVYGRYSDYGLPDTIVFTFNTRDYKLPKGITLDYDDGSEKDSGKLKDKKGRVEINYTSYTINKGVDDKVFSR